MTVGQRERKNARQRERYAADDQYRERVLAVQRERDKTVEGRAKKLARKKRWQTANREKYLEQTRRHNERRRQRPEVMEDNRRRVAEWQKANPGKFLSMRLKKFGLSLDDYIAMLREQRNRCAICGDHETARRPSGKRKRLAVDHCHATGRVRGLLCGSCNHTLGHMRDDPSLLRRAAAYLEVT